MSSPGADGELSSTSQGVLVFSGIIFASLAGVVLSKIVAFLLSLYKSSAQRNTATTPELPSAAAQQQSRGQHSKDKKRGPDLKTLIKESKAAEKAKKAAGKEDSAAHHHLFVATLKGHQDVVNGVGWSADGSALATACSDLQVRVFDLSSVTKTQLFRYFRTKRTPLDVGFGDSPTTAIVLLEDIPNEATVEMYKYAPASKDSPAGWSMAWQVKKVHGKEAPMCMETRPSSVEVPGTSGARVGVAVCLSKKKDVKILDFQGREVGVAEPNSLNNHQLAVSGNSRFLAVASFTADVKIWEMKHSRDGFRGTAKAMDLKGHSSQVMAVALSPDGTRAATASKDGTLRVWNINVRYDVNEDPRCLVKVDLALPKGKCYQRLAWAPDSTLAASLDGKVHFIDTASGQLLEELDAHDGEITALHWAPQPVAVDGAPVSLLATSSKDHRVRLWRSPASLRS